jgi:heme A synthase
VSQTRASSRPTPDDAHWGANPAPQNGSAPTVRSARIDRTVVLAYILAVSIPPVGFILGAVVAIRFGKPTARHGALIITVSIVAALVWAAIIAGGALNTPSTDF